jgi:hypothetical protein
MIKYDRHFNTPQQCESVFYTDCITFWKDEAQLRLGIAKTVVNTFRENVTVVINLDTD